MRNTHMLRAWLEVRGWRDSGPSYTRVTENGILEIPHAVCATMMHHAPELFAHFIRGVEIDQRANMRMLDIEVSARVLD